MIEWIIDLLFTPVVPGVSYSIAWWIPAAAGAAISIGGQLLGNKNKKDTSRDRQNMRESRGNFSDYLNQMIERGNTASNQPRLTADDLFGGQIQSIQDRAGANANATKRMLSRSIMGSGGDISGSRAGNLLGVDESMNDAVGKNLLNFENLALGENRYQTSRGDRLMGMGLQGLQNLYGMDKDMLMDKVKQNQASNQRRSNFLGNVMNAGVTLSAAKLCWGAIELYGEDSHEFHSIRTLLASHMENGGELQEFAEEYKEHGEEWAAEIRRDPEKRRKAKVLFDHLYELSKAA